MGIFGALLLIAAIAFVVFVWFCLGALSFFTWFPDRTPDKYKETVELAAVFGRPIWKWIVPFCLVMMFISVVSQVIKHLLVGGT